MTPLARPLIARPINEIWSIEASIKGAVSAKFASSFSLALLDWMLEGSLTFSDDSECSQGWKQRTPPVVSIRCRPILRGQQLRQGLSTVVRGNGKNDPEPAERSRGPYAGVGKMYSEREIMVSYYFK